MGPVTRHWGLRIKAGLLVTAACLAAMVFSGIAANAGELRQTSLDRLMTLSGTREQVSEIPRLLRIGMERARAREKTIHNPPTMSDAEYEELETTAIDAFKPAGILESIGKAVRQAVSEEDAEKMLAWYDSDAGKRIERAETKAAGLEGYRDMPDSSKALLADAPRVRFAKRLDALLRTTDTAMRLQLNTAVAMFVIFSTKKNLHAPANPKALKKRLSAGLERTRPKMARAVMLSTLYTYKGIDMPSLNRYLGFLESPRMTRFNKAMRAGMEAGMDQAMDTMARTVSTLLKKQHMQTI